MHMTLCLGSFMKNVLKSFNFGPSIIKWISTFYNKTQVAINQGGNLSSFFHTERGCKQGDPISQYLFILCAEILAIKIKNIKVNFTKTHVVWIGSKKYSTDSIKTKWKLNWGVNRFKLLGITFDTDLDKMLTLNFTDKIANIKTKINYWNRRSLTPIGRITVIKSLLLSSLNHLFVSLPNPNEKLLKDLNELFFKFYLDRH